MSKPMAKWSTGAQVIDTRRARTSMARGAVRLLSEKAGIGMPEVAVYDASQCLRTGAFRDSSLVAVSHGRSTP